NDNTDIFSLWFEEDIIYADPGEKVVFNLSVQSNSRLTLVILAQSSLGVNPPRSEVSTSPENQYHTQGFELTAPSEPGEYTLSVRVSPEDCSESYCTKILDAKLVVGDAPDKTGFEVSLNPENIDVSKPEGVPMRFTIRNNNPEEMSFKAVITTEPGDAGSSFKEEMIKVGSYSSKTKVFIITPGSSSSLYEINLNVESSQEDRSLTSFITIDELKTDAIRQAEGLGSDSQAELNQWLSEHESGESGLEEYGSLKQSLNQAAENQPSWNESEYRETYNNLTNGNEETPFTIQNILIVALIIAGVILVVIFLRRGSGNKDEAENYY
ncbi:MAG: hypothetical protein ABIH52_04635, partial [Candidatus Aenigmatarchaeota archaeon]